MIRKDVLRLKFVELGKNLGELFLRKGAVLCNNLVRSENVIIIQYLVGYISQAKNLSRANIVDIVLAISIPVLDKKWCHNHGRHPIWKTIVEPTAGPQAES